MTLDQWLSQNNLSTSEFGRQIGVTGEAVRRWRSGERMPEPEHVELVAASTDGGVTIADMHGTRLAWLRAKQRPVEAA